MDFWPWVLSPPEEKFLDNAISFNMQPPAIAYLDGGGRDKQERC